MGTIQVRVPYRVVGLVVGPKGATIKRIQQQTHTYIVTPSRDKEPVFEVTGLPENVEAARKEIEAHIAIRTGSSDFGGSNGGSNGLNGFFNLNDNGSNGDSANDMFSAPSGGLNSPFSASSGNLDHSSILNNETNGFFKSNSHSGMTLANLLDSSNNYGDLSRNVAWSNGTDSHDLGIGHSPPFEGGLGGGSVSGNGSNGIGAHSTGNNSSAPFKNSFLNHASSTNGHDSSNNTLTSGIWGELNKVLGGLDLSGGTGNNGTSSVNNHHNEINKQFLNIGSRSSLDLGTLGRPTTLTPPQEVTSSATSTLSSSNMLQNNTANGIGRQMSLPTDHNTTLPDIMAFHPDPLFSYPPPMTKEFGWFSNKRFFTNFFKVPPPPTTSLPVIPTPEPITSPVSLNTLSFAEYRTDPSPIENDSDLDMFEDLFSGYNGILSSSSSSNQDTNSETK